MEVGLPETWVLASTFPNTHRELSGPALPRVVRLIGSRNRLSVHVPDVQGCGICRGRNFEPSFASGSIQRRAYFFFRRGQFGQRHFERRAVIQLREVLEQRCHDRFMPSIAALRYVRLDHRFEAELFGRV